MRGRAARKPRVLLKGKKVLDYKSGETLYENDSNTMIQYGQFVSKKNYDSLTQDQRQQQVDGMM